ncbi:hypothetical protein ACX93W_05895 [Paenibacillus sp. CAU 1782]
MRLKEVADQLAEERLLDPACFWHCESANGAFRTNGGRGVLELAASGIPLEGLNAAELRVLRLHVSLHGASPIEEETLVSVLRRRTALTGAECRLALDRLERRGFMYALRKTWGERFVFVPSDLYAALLAGLPDTLPVAPCSDGVFPAAPLNTGQGIGGPLPLGRALIYCLSQLRRESSTAFTAKGILSKKMSDKLERAFPIPADVLERFGFWAKGEERCSTGVALLLEAASRLNLLVDAGKGVRVNEQGLEKWLEQSDGAREMELRDWLCDLIFAAAGPAAHYGAKMLWLPDGEWHRAQDLHIDDLTENGVPDDGVWEESPSRDYSAQNWLKLFFACGWLECGYVEGEGTEPVFRWRSFSDVVENEVIVQPDGELLVGPHTSGGVRWRLEEIADRISDDLFTLYRLSENRLHWNLDNGALIEEIGLILTRLSGQQSLPESVESMLQQWCQSWEQKGGRPAGFQARNKSVPTAEEPTSQTGMVSQRRFLDGAQPLSQNQWDQIQLDHDQKSPFRLDRFREQIASVPAMWMKHRRSYHHSTCRELITTAISLETAVELSMDGVRVLFIPEATEQRGNLWSVTGKFYGDCKLENRAFGPEKWDEIRLVLPSGTAISGNR